MSNPTCSSCRAFNALTRECRRESPKVLAVPKAGSMDVHGVFPGTLDTGWCMQHTELTMVFYAREAATEARATGAACAAPEGTKLEIVSK